METLRMIFPFSFTQKTDFLALGVNILIYVVACWLVGFVLGLLHWIPLVGWVLELVTNVVELYTIAGIVLSALDYMKVLK